MFCTDCQGQNPGVPVEAGRAKHMALHTTKETVDQKAEGMEEISEHDFPPRWDALLEKSRCPDFFDLCGYTSDCATHEKEKNYHESTEGRKHEKMPVTGLIS